MRPIRAIAFATVLTSLATAPSPASAAGSTANLFVSVTVVRSVPLPDRGSAPVAERAGAADVPAIFAGRSGTLRRVSGSAGAAERDVLTAVPDGAPPSLVIEEAVLD